MWSRASFTSFGPASAWNLQQALSLTSVRSHQGRDVQNCHAQELRQICNERGERVLRTGDRVDSQLALAY